MNAIVGQSGGPTSVINSSLAGVFQAAQKRGVSTIFGMLNGIAGFLEDRVIDLSTKFNGSMEIELLKRTPSSFLGSCRYKLPTPEENEEVYKQIFDKLDKLDIRYFFYIGGNDSMDTIGKLSAYAQYIGSDIQFMGVPKTIDNDLQETDHTPGFGSAAKYISVVMKELIRDATVYGTNYVTIVEIMGRNAGWLTASAALAQGDDCDGVDMICMPEIQFNVENFIDKVDKMQQKKKSIIVAVSEGVKLASGEYVCSLSDDARFKDAFGHTNLTGTARYLSNRVAEKIGTKTRCIELSTLQRCAAHLSSRVDITEAYQVGGAAVKAAFEGHTGEMVTIKRISNSPYQYITDTIDVKKVANLEKKVPISWINSTHTGMNNEFIQYAKPLIQAELSPIFIDGSVRHIHL